MNQRLSFIRAMCLWSFCCLVLAGCQIEGGVPDTTTTTASSPLPQATDTSIAAARADRANTWAIGLVDTPQTLLPYQPSTAEQRRAAPILELLFPSPVLSYNYAFTETGVLESIPTLQSGDAELRQADVFLDAAGVITTTETAVITQVNQLVVTFSWNPDLRWSDGTPLTAADSVFSYEMAKAAPPNDEARDRLDQTLSYEQVDEHTTRAVLKPDLTGPAYFMNFWRPLPRHLLEGTDPTLLAESEFARAPISYGPYMIDTQSPGELRLKRNPHYFGTAPSIEQVRFIFNTNIDLLRAGVENGNLDMMSTDRLFGEEFARLGDLAATDDLQVLYSETPVWEHIDFNLDVPALQKIQVRQALAYGTNRQAMIDAAYAGKTGVLNSWVLPRQPEAAPPDQLVQYSFEPDRARALLDEAGYTDTDGDGIRNTPDGISLTLQLLTTANSPARQQIAEQFRDNMRDIGVDVQLGSSDSMLAIDGPLYQRQFQLALFGWSVLPTALGQSLWSCDAVPSAQNGYNGQNFAGWCFRDANRAILRGASSLDRQQRAGDYLLQQQIWTRELPALPLFQRVGITLVAPDVQGVQPDTFAPLTWNLATWTRN